jgi:hypothetical protein
MRGIVLILCLTVVNVAHGETNKEYKNRFIFMLDHAVQLNTYVRQRLQDRGFSSYAHAMAEKNASEAEQMTPPKKYTMIHPHFLLVLENIERSFFFAQKGDLLHYRQHQKLVRKELRLLESLAERDRLDLYLWNRCK